MIEERIKENPSRKAQGKFVRKILRTIPQENYSGKWLSNILRKIPKEKPKENSEGPI